MSLPKHIYAHPKGYRIQIRRGELLIQGFVANGVANPLQSAVTLRDKLLIAAGPVVLRRSRAWSNTGVPGISETVWWTHNRRFDCFAVHLGKKHRPQSKRVLYGVHRTRAAAWNKAIALRKAVGGIIPAEVGNPSSPGFDATREVSHV